jgi:hypothetical protein
MAGIMGEAGGVRPAWRSPSYRRGEVASRAVSSEFTTRSENASNDKMLADESPELAPAAKASTVFPGWN